MLYNKFYIDIMDNIQIKRTTKKKSMESLLEESAIDNEFNYEAQQIKQQYNKSIKQLQQKIKENEEQIQKLQQQLEQKNKQIKQQQEQLSINSKKMSKIITENNQLKKMNNNINKQLNQVQYKLEVIQKNRNSVPEFQYMNDSDEIEFEKVKEIKNNSKRQVYKQITQILSRKVEKFLGQLKKYPMNVELQQYISFFLEEIIYFNSKESRKSLFEGKLLKEQRKRSIGKISERKHHKIMNQKLSDMEQWKKLQKSLNKLKNVESTDQFALSRNRQRKNVETSYNTSMTMSIRPLINYV